MTDAEIQECIARLDSAAPRQNAEVIFRSFGETAVYANREGYLRLGVEFLKRAFDETNDQADIAYMISTESEFSIDHFATTREELDFLST